MGPTQRIRIKLSIKAFFLFYRVFVPFTGICSLATFYYFAEAGVLLLPLFFWFKIFSSAGIFLYISNYRRNEHYYYRNLGFRINSLWILTFLFDFALWSATISVIHYL